MSDKKNPDKAPVREGQPRIQADENRPANQVQDTSAAATGQTGDALQNAPKAEQREAQIPVAKRVKLINRQPQKLVVNVRGEQGDTLSVEINARSHQIVTVHQDGELGPDVPVKVRRGVLQVVAVEEPKEEPKSEEDKNRSESK